MQLQSTASAGSSQWQPSSSVGIPFVAHRIHVQGRLSEVEAVLYPGWDREAPAARSALNLTSAP